MCHQAWYDPSLLSHQVLVDHVPQHRSEWLAPTEILSRCAVSVCQYPTDTVAKVSSWMPHGKNSQSILSYFQNFTFVKCSILLVARMKEAPTTTVDSHWLPVEQWTGPSKSLQISRSRYSNPKHRKTKQQKQEDNIKGNENQEYAKLLHTPEWMKTYFIPYYEQNMSVSCCLGPRDPWIMVSYSSISPWTRQAAPSLSAGPKKVRHR